MAKYYAAVDMGASSGRLILGHMENGRMELEEIHRFENGMVKKDGELCWEFDRIFKEIVAGLKKCKEIGKIPVSMGVDTWGVDFVLLDKDDKVLLHKYSLHVWFHSMECLFLPVPSLLPRKNVYVRFHQCSGMHCTAQHVLRCQKMDCTHLLLCFPEGQQPPYLPV